MSKKKTTPASEELSTKDGGILKNIDKETANGDRKLCIGIGGTGCKAGDLLKKSILSSHARSDSSSVRFIIVDEDTSPIDDAE